MQGGDWPQVRDLALIGGGHAHALFLRMWGMKPLAGVRVTVINPGPAAPYTGMLPGYIAGHYARSEMMIDLVRLARFAGARIVLDRAVGLDRALGRVLLESGRSVRYDVASIDIGISSNLPDLSGFADHAVAAKPLGGYAERWAQFVEKIPNQPKVVVIGAGVGGVELAMASVFRLRSAGAEPQVTLLERAEHALPGVGQGARTALLAELERLDVRLMTGVSPVSFGSGQVVLGGGQVLQSDFTLSVAGARPQGWLAVTGLELTDGFVTVGPSLQSSDPAIFAVGDCAHMAFAPRPKAGVFAVRQAMVLYDNLCSALSGRQMRHYTPQRDYLKLISTGGKRAVADKLGLRLEGPWLWRWKDQIDRKFMAKFGVYPKMARITVPSVAAIGLATALNDKPMCGGCGAKVAAGTLGAALLNLPAPKRKDVLSGPGDDAAILVAATGLQVITTDHLRAFTYDPALMARVTAIHAMGDIWAMGATPQTALSQITLPRLGPEIQADMLAEIMLAAAEVFGAAGADIVGGHTSVGAELTIGFTVTGLADRIILKSGARPGDILILTKPIGTGTILAAEMVAAQVPGLLLGESVEACYASMVRSLGTASGVLARYATAMTDVTGFGLAGHIIEILQASGVAAILNLKSVPMLLGAREIAAAGHASTLAPSNRANAMPLMSFIETPAAALLFDPQTCGGLLAAIPATRLNEVIEALAEVGETAATIGTVVKGAAFLTVV